MHPEALSPHSTCRAFRSASPLLFPVRPSPVDPPQRLIQRVDLVHLVDPPHGPVAVNPHRPPMTVRAQADRREVPALFDVVGLHDPARPADRTARFLHPSHVGRLGAGDCLGVLRSHAASWLALTSLTMPLRPPIRRVTGSAIALPSAV